MTNTNIQKYLVGDNPNLYGSIISFKKGWRKNNPDFVEYYSFLLYFSHETGRIERFLYNSGTKNNQIFNELFFEEDKNLEVEEISRFPYNKNYNPKEIVETRNDLNKFVNNLDKFIELNSVSKISFKSLNDGKINKNMFNLFLLELFRDYFIFKQSYHYCDMMVLRKYTEARIEDEIDILKLGTGKNIFKKELSMDLINLYPGMAFTEKRLNSFYKSITEFYADIYINYEINNNLLINLPKNFNNNYTKNFINDMVENNNYEIISLDKNNQPECLIDLKCYINSRNVISHMDLVYKVYKFNNFINNKINKMK